MQQHYSRLSWTKLPRQKKCVETTIANSILQCACDRIVSFNALRSEPIPPGQPGVLSPTLFLMATGHMQMNTHHSRACKSSLGKEATKQEMRNSHIAARGKNTHVESTVGGSRPVDTVIYTMISVSTSRETHTTTPCTHTKVWDVRILSRSLARLLVAV